MSTEREKPEPEESYQEYLIWAQSKSSPKSKVQRQGVMDWMCVSSPSSYGKALTLNVLVFGDGAS